MAAFDWFPRKSATQPRIAAADGEEVGKRLEHAWDARWIIDLLDEEANEILGSHGIDGWPRLVPVPEHIQAATGYPTFPVWSMPEGTSDKAQHAGRLLEMIRVVRGFLYSSGSVNDAVVLGIRLGIAAEQAGLADLIPLAKRSVKLTPEGCGRHNEAIQESKTLDGFTNTPPKP